MTWPDYAVLVGYFAVMIVIGIISSRSIKGQEDYFMGGRGFGKILQTFAAFGAGTGSSDPVNTGRTTFTSGLSGMWSVMYWLFVTPFYWITSVWYRRMRHLTLGDWFVERYESKALGAAYCLFGLLFFMVYGSMLFSAIGKVAAPLANINAIAIGETEVPIEYFLVPIIGVVVLAYGVLGGLRAAYYTDLIQGICIILLSIMLIPFGLNALVEQFGDPSRDGMMAGFRILHEQLPQEHFDLVGSSSMSEFPWYRVVAIVLINLMGIVVQPHFIATGGGSAKSEWDARVGLVVGNFLKRFCTVGWMLTALIALALFAGHPELAGDPDKTWGIASRELLSPGLTGLMVACLLAALMSSVDAYMIVGSGLVVRNVYAAYINENASEKECVRVGRLTGSVIVAGAVLISLLMMDVFEQLQLTWVLAVSFAAPFWIGMYWRRATASAAWITVAYCAIVFFIAPNLLPFVPGVRTAAPYTITNDFVETTTTRAAAPSDVARRNLDIELWRDQQEQAQQQLATAKEDNDAEGIAQLEQQIALLEATGPMALAVGDQLTEVTRTGGQPIFWSGGVSPIDENGNPIEGIQLTVVKEQRLDENSTQKVMRYPEDITLRASGNFKLDLLLFQLLGVDLRSKSNAAIDTLGLLPKMAAPMLVMIAFSLFTRRNNKDALDRYYAKMNTPVDPDHQRDQSNLEAAMEDPSAIERHKIIPGSDLEFYWPSKVDLTGFIICVAVCFGIIAIAGWVAGIGG